MTAARPWYKRFPAAFIAATAGMPIVRKGIYSLVLDMIYDHGGPIEDKAADIIRVLGCNFRTWIVHRAALIEAGKLVVENGTLSNPRADVELCRNATEPFAEMQRSNISGTKPKKSNGHADIPQRTYARARGREDRDQKEPPGDPPRATRKGEPTPSRKSIREKRSRGKRDKATNLENWQEAVELRRRWRDQRGGDGGPTNSGELS